MKIKAILAVISALSLSYQGYSQENIEVDKYAYDTDWAKISRSNPLFINGNVIKADIGADVAYSSVITPFSAANLPAHIIMTGTRNTNNGRSFGWMSNYPVKRMLQVLYGKDPLRDSITKANYLPILIPDSRTAFQDVDSSKLVLFLGNKPVKQNLFNIQLTTSRIISTKTIREQMIGDIEVYFGLKTSLQKQVKKCVVISRNGLPIPEYESGDISYLLGTKKGKGFIDMNNVPMSQLIDYLIVRPFKKSDYPVVDETAFNKNLGRIAFSVAEEVLNYENLKNSLDKFGLKLSIEDREVEILVISKAEEEI